MSNIKTLKFEFPWMKSTKHIFGWMQKSCTNLILHPSSIFLPYLAVRAMRVQKNNLCIVIFVPIFRILWKSKNLAPPPGWNPETAPEFRCPLSQFIECRPRCAERKIEGQSAHIHNRLEYRFLAIIYGIGDHLTSPWP